MPHIEEIKDYWNMRANGFSMAVEEELKTDPNLDDLRKFLYIENANRPYCTYEELTRITYHEGLRFRNARELTPQEDESFQKAMKEQGISFVY